MASSKRSVKRAATIMFLYALVVLAVSLLAYVMAPPGANATTAVIMGAGSALIMSAMAVMTLLIDRNRKVGMIGIHIGLLLPLVFAAAFFARIEVAHRSSGQHRYFERAFQQKVENGARQDTDQARTAFFVDAKDSLSGGDVPPTDKAYLGRTLTLLFGASTATFVLLLLSRPSVPKKNADPFAADAPAASNDTSKTADFKA